MLYLYINRITVTVIIGSAAPLNAKWHKKAKTFGDLKKGDKSLEGPDLE